MDQYQAPTKKSNDTSIIEILELSHNEMDLIRTLRHRCRFGQVTITVHNGQPMELKQVIEIIKLGEKKSYPQGI